MAFQEDFSDEECMMLNILIDEDFQSDTSIKCETSNQCNSKLRTKNNISSRTRKRRKKSVHSRNMSEKKMILRPNYFVAIKVSNPEIHRAIKMVQEAVLNREPALRTTTVPIPTLHLTLAVVHLSDIEQVKRAADKVDTCSQMHKEFFSHPASLHFEGLKTFRNQVLYAGIKQGEVLEEVQKMATYLETSFQDLTGISSKKGFNPHLTIFKLSNDFTLRRKGIFKISNNLYSDMSDTIFGSQVVQGIQLLSMTKPKDTNGYYYCSHQVSFDVPSSESDDHLECCKKPLSMMSKMKHTSKLLEIHRHDKDVVKRRFHSLSLTRLTTIFGGSHETVNRTDRMDSLFTSLFLIGFAAVAVTAIVRGFSSSR